MNPSGGALPQLRADDAHDIGQVSDVYELLHARSEVLPRDAILENERTSIAPASRRP